MFQLIYDACHFTEIELAVNNLREFLLADIEDEEMRIALENRIEEFVEDRKQGFPINSWIANLPSTSTLI